MYYLSISASRLSELSLPKWINPYRDLETRIDDIAKGSLSGRLSATQMADLQRGFKLAHRWLWPAGRMRTLLSTLPKEVIKGFMQELLTTGDMRDVDYYFQRCLRFLNDAELPKLADVAGQQDLAALFAIHCLTKSTALKHGFEKEGRAIWREILIELKFTVHQVLDLLVSITGINELIRQKHHRSKKSEAGLDSIEANAKLQVYLRLVSYPAIIFGTISSYIQSKASAVFLTATPVVTVLTALVAYNRYWKPCPIDHEGLQNLSIDLLREKDSIYPRQKILKKIEAAFRAGKGAILVGPPGVGKSWIMRSFVQQASAGKICKFIKDPQVFSCNAASFSDLGRDGNSFACIQERFKRYKDQVVFFFDEFHSLFRKQKIGAAASEQIKTFCEGYKYVIGATTTGEYKKYIAKRRTIVKRRFKIIQVPPMSRDELKIALSQHLDGRNSKIGFDPAILDYIIEKVEASNPGTSVVDAAYSLLNSAIQKMAATGQSELEERIATLEDELGVLAQESINGPPAGQLPAQVGKLKEKEQKIATTKTELQQNHVQTQHLKKMETYYLALKRQSYQLATPSSNAQPPRQWAELQVRIHMVLQCIMQGRQSLGLPRCLDKTLIDSVHDETESEGS